MNKSLKWTLVILAILAVVFIAIRMKGGNSKVEKVATERAAKRTIIESVSTSGKIYPETEVKVSPDFSGQVTRSTAVATTAAIALHSPSEGAAWLSPLRS